VRASCADRAAGERMLADVRSGLERLRAIDGPQGFLLRTTPENIRPGRREAGRGSRARRRRPAEPGGGGQETCVDLNAQPSPSPSPSPSDATIERSACCRISSSAVALGRSRQGHRGDG
jgi:hypothetical protein